MKIRKLFPALTETNQTIDCPDFCDPSCPYNCYPYPDYSYLPPGPPPPPLSPPRPAPPLSGSHNRYISPYVIILVSVLASFILLVGYYVIVVKLCFGWCCSNRQRQPRTGVSDEEFVDENRVDHPIWFITTVGLQQSIINSITVCKYKKGEGLIEGTECSVCLNEFREDETVRLLPKCNHAFHISCIDTWLRAHTNCPLCRAHIVFDAVSAAPPTTVDLNSDNMDVVFDNQMANPDQNTELRENRAGADDGGSELPEPNDRRISKDGVDENGGSVVSDRIDNNQVFTKEIKQIKRCVSMYSSSSTATLFYGLSDFSAVSLDQQEDIKNPNSSINQKQEEGPKSSKSRLMGNSSIVQHLHLNPVPMKRSISCSGRFFSSKRCRSMNLILPL